MALAPGGLPLRPLVAPLAQGHGLQSEVLLRHSGKWRSQRVRSRTCGAVLMSACAAQAASRTKRKKLDPVMRGDLSPPREVPEHIPRPPYLGPGQPKCPQDGFPRHEYTLALDNTPEERLILEVKTEEQIQGMREACKLARATLEVCGRAVRAGVTTDELDRVAHEFIVENGAYPSPLGYLGFPKAICTSVNEIVGHGIPDSRPLADGDFLNVDVTVYLNGYHGDSSCTFFAGRPLKRSLAITKAAHKAMMAGIKVCKPGLDFREIGKAITQSAQEDGYVVHPTLSGHGIGSYFHGRPEIIPYINDTEQGVMKAGMTFTVEPVLVDLGDKTVAVDEQDMWTLRTLKSAWAAQFEHTILITETGYEILTGPTVDYKALMEAQAPARKMPKRRGFQ